jgi:hypothetical protein
MNHYLTAAMQAIPEDPETAIAWAEDYLDKLGLDRPRTEGTTTRLRVDVAERMRELTTLLPVTGRYGLVGYVQMAALARLLDALDALDESKNDQAVAQ